MAETADLTSPLSDATRKERRLLLITSVLLLLVVLGGLRPTQIAVLGIDFITFEQSILVTILFGVHAFVLVAFVLAARAEGRTWDERFSGVRKKLAKQIHECSLKITDGTLHPAEKMAAAIDLLGEILDQADAHLRTQTVADTRYTLSVADMARNSERAREADDWEQAFSTYPKPGLGFISGLQPAHAGIFRAVMQKEIDNFYSQIRHSRGIRPRIMRRMYRKHLRNMHFKLRYTPAPVSDLRKAVDDVERLRRRAGLTAPEHLTLDDIRTRLEELDGTLGHLHDDIEVTANRFTQMALSGPLQGAADVGWKLHDRVSEIEADVRRSMRRFGSNSFWERHVPVLIGLGTLVLAFVHAYANGLFSFR